MADTEAPAANGEAFVEGLVYPPPAVREIVDKTAAHIGKQGPKGPALEEKIKSRKEPRFSFINEEDPYYPYYQHRLAQIKSGAAATDGASTPAGKDAAAKEAQVPDDGRPKVPQPAPFEFLLDLPTLSAIDFDIIKLTALFVARNGRKFQSELATREKSNYQFDFLQPAHSLFPTFNRLVEQYTKLLVHDEKYDSRLAHLRTQGGTAKGADVSERERRRAGRRALKSELNDRVAWTVWEAEKRQKEADEAETRRVAFAEIDWQDFVVVATVEFTEADDEAELEAPQSLSEVVNMSMRDKHRVAMQMEGKQLPTDQDEAQVMEDAARAAENGGDQDDTEMDMEDDEEPRQVQDEIKTAATAPDANVKIRPKDYVPKSKRQAKTGLTKCTVCGEMIPVDEITEHVRIELLDPRWKEKQEVAEHNRAASNMLGTGADVAASLRKMAQQRADIFSEAGMTDAEKRQQAEEEIKRKAKEREAIVWDGHIASADLSQQRFQTSANLESQISALHRAKGLTEDAEQTRIGPSAGGPPEDAAAMAASIAPPISTTTTEPAAASSSTSAGLEAGTGSATMTSGATISAGPQANMLNLNRQMYNPYGVPIMQPGQTTLPDMNPTSSAASAADPAAAAAAPVPAPTSSAFNLGAPPGHVGAPPAHLGAPPAQMARPAEEPPEEEPAAKRAKTVEAPQYIDEQEWLDSHPEPIALYVQMPESADRAEWDVHGQLITLPEVPLTALVSTLRERIHSQTQVPPGKQQIKWNDRILANKNTLASYNFENGEKLTVTIKKK